MATKEENYYNILNVSQDATIEAITLAFNNSLKKISSFEKNNLNTEDTNQKEQTKIKEAFLILSNTEKRKAYDLFLSNLKKENCKDNTNSKNFNEPTFTPITKIRFSNKLDLLKILAFGILGALIYLYIVSSYIR